MTTSEASSRGAGWSPSWLVRLGWGLLLGLFTWLSASLILESFGDLDASLTVWGDVEVAEGERVQLRAALRNRHSARVLHGEALSWSARDAQGRELDVPVERSAEGERASFVMGREPVQVRVEAPEESGLRREVSFTVRPVVPAEGWLPLRDGRGGSPPQGSVGPLLLAGDRVEGVCPLTLEVRAETGVATQLLATRLWVRVSDAAGQGVEGVRVSWRRPVLAEEAPREVVTGPGGLASLELVPDDLQEWVLRLDCEGGTLERGVTLRPSADGLRVRPATPVLSASEVLWVELDVLRQAEQVWLDVVCDGDWVLQGAVPASRGAQAYRLDALTPLPAGRSWRWCVAQARAWLGAGAPSSSSPFVQASASLSAEEALRRAFSALPAPWRSEVGLVGIGGGEGIAWALAGLPQVSLPLPLIENTLDGDRERFEAGRAQRVMRLRRLLIGCLGVMALALAGAMVQARQESRARLLALDDEEGGEVSAELLRSSSLRLAMILGLGMIFGFLLLVVFLARLMRL